MLCDAIANHAHSRVLQNFMAANLGEQSLQFNLLAQETPQKAAAKAFIEKNYDNQLGAKVKVDYPLLITISNRSGLQAAVGLRSAAQQKLFLEQYLDLPVEKALENSYSQTIARSGIVELGSFVSVNRAASLYIIAVTAAYMNQNGFDYALVTATQRLRRVFNLFDFNLKTLCQASEDRLIDRSAHWGSYYEDSPEVLVGSVSQCLDATRSCHALTRHQKNTEKLEAHTRQMARVA